MIRGGRADGMVLGVIGGGGSSGGGGTTRGLVREVVLRRRRGSTCLRCRERPRWSVVMEDGTLGRTVLGVLWLKK